MKTEKIISEYNEKLFKKLFGDKKEPIAGNSLTNPNDAIFGKSFEQIANEHLQNIIEQQEFLTELEQIKNNL